MEQYLDGGLFEGKNYVFDQRILTAPSEYKSSCNNNNTNNTNAITSDTAIINITDHCDINNKNNSVELEHQANCENNISTMNNINNMTIMNITGKCSYCDTLYDFVSKDRTCCVCRHDVICCDKCVQTKPYTGEYHCSNHWYGLCLLY